MQHSVQGYKTKQRMNKGYLVDDARKVTTHRLREMKEQGKKIAMLTAYDYTMAHIVDSAGVDVFWLATVLRT